MFLRTVVFGSRVPVTARVSHILEPLGAIARAAHSIEELRTILGHEPVDLVVVEAGPVAAERPSLISEIRGLPDCPEVVLLLDREDAEARAGLQASGAYAVLDLDLPDALLREALATLVARRLEETRSRLEHVPGEDFSLGDYVTRSPVMRTLLVSARRISHSDTTLLLLGETGVGKGLLARSIHNEGSRAGGPFVSINCGALTETLLEAELFGHERGAYTGADRARRGYFELAHRGTLFLDEIAEIPPHLQVKLLHVLEERRVRPVGSERKIDVDVRLVAATNRDLRAEVAAKRFREDLYFRLNVVTLTLPPLRERREDIREIAEGYVEHFRLAAGTGVSKISERAMASLLAYSWPGNVRELANAIERAVILGMGDEIELGDLPIDLQTAAPTSASDVCAPPPRIEADATWAERPWRDVRREILEAAELRYLRTLLEATGGRVGLTAQRAGIDPRSLHQKMKRYGLRKEDFRG